jgi:hypothetical protein
MGLREENAELQRRIKLLDEDIEFKRTLMERHGDDCNKLHQLWDADKILLRTAQETVLAHERRLAKHEEHITQITKESEVRYARLADLKQDNDKLLSLNGNLIEANVMLTQTIKDLAAAIKALTQK